VSEQQNEQQNEQQVAAYVLPDETAQVRAARGAALLDEQGPFGWDERINRHALDMGVASQCILGQSYDGEYASGYRRGCAALGLEPCMHGAEPTSAMNAIAYGFIIAEYDDPSLQTCTERDAALHDAWIALLAERGEEDEDEDEDEDEEDDYSEDEYDSDDEENEDDD